MKRKLSQTVVYQIYPRSFKDSNGDGVGDLQGVISKLDYLEELGIDLVWLTPFYISPGNDNGYDIQDYYHVDPLFGTDEDVDRLIQEAEKRGIGIMLDMVFNHTSTYHEWFQKAKAGDPEYQQRYFFRKEKTNWQSKFGGNAWEYLDDLGLYYLHLFDVTQADLNWESQAVFKEVCSITRYWLDKGVSGLRFDVINLISKPDHFEDDDHGDGRRFYTDGVHVHDYLHALNRETFGQYPGITTVGELSSTSIDNAVKYADPSRQELSTVFGFHHLKVDYKDGYKWELQPFDFLELKRIMNNWQIAMQDGDALGALFWSNHDQPRVVSRFGDYQQYPIHSAKMLATITHLLRGMPYVYQGEEIGMGNAYFEDIDDYRDVESKTMYQELRQIKSHDEVMHILQERSRDNSRTPIPWDSSRHHGFSSHQPWIDFSHAEHVLTVEDNLSQEESVFYWVKQLIDLRHQESVVSDGRVQIIDLDDPMLFNFLRETDEKRWLIVNNFMNTPTNYSIPSINGRIVLSNYHDSTLTQTLELRPYESIVIEYLK